MFTATSYPLPSQRAIERTGVANDLFGCFPVTTPAQRIVCLVIERNVQNWAQIQIETEKPEQPSCDLAMTTDEIYIIPVAELLSIRRFATDQSKARNAASFLINSNDGLDFA